MKFRVSITVIDEKGGASARVIDVHTKAGTLTPDQNNSLAGMEIILCRLSEASDVVVEFIAGQ